MQYQQKMNGSTTTKDSNVQLASSTLSQSIKMYLNQSISQQQSTNEPASKIHCAPTTEWGKHSGGNSAFEVLQGK
jgi:hypothetical protein